MLSALLTITLGGYAQSVSGNLSLLKAETIDLMGFNGFSTYNISSAKVDSKGDFSLSYNKKDTGVGYLISADNKPYFIILSGENIEIIGEALSYTESIKITKGKENQWFEQFAAEHPRREQALDALIYLEKVYSSDPLFIQQNSSLLAFEKEKARIANEDAAFLAKIPKESYVRWFLPTRKLLSSVSSIAKNRTEEIPATITAFRKIDYSDHRLYRSGMLKDAIENHFWLIENSGIPLDSVFFEMKKSIDHLLPTLVTDEKKLNEVSQYLFNLLEKHSLYDASEYLALKILNEVSCTIDSDLAKQLESYRAMKKGNIAPEIKLAGFSYLNGYLQNQIQQLADLEAPYTLVIFGASWCPNCNEELPKAIQQYAHWRKLGVELVFVSLDTEAAIVEQYMKAIPFIAFCDFQKWESAAVKDYHVFATPSMFLLNKKREILLRPNSIEHFNAWVDWYLVQGNK